MNGGNSGQATGTIGSPQQTTDQSTYTSQETANERDLAERVSLIDELRRSGVKFTEANIQFITRDATGQIVWLETGNSSAGLTHIIERHADDFLRAQHVDPNGISNYLHEVFRTGKVCYSKIKKGRQGGFERLYLSSGQYYLLSGIGSNGFIISAYPINKKKAQKLIERNAHGA